MRDNLEVQTYPNNALASPVRTDPIVFVCCLVSTYPIPSPIVWLIRFQQPHLQGTTRMLRAAINVLSDISCSLLYWDWGSESIKETPHFHLLLRPFAELSSANGLNLRLEIFLSDSNIPPPRRFVASLSHGFQPQTMEFRIRRNFWRIRAAFRVGQSLMRWRAGFGQSDASPLLSPFLNVLPSPQPLAPLTYTLRHYEELSF